MSILLELRFHRNVNFYKVYSLKVLKMSHLFPNHISGNLLDYSLLINNNQ